MTINNLSEIDFASGQQVEFDATIISITTEGNIQEKKPVKFVMKLESTGELVNGVSWSSGLLPIIKPAVDTLDIFHIDGIPRSFNNFNEVRIGTLKNTGRQSNIKVIHKTDFDTIKTDFIGLLNRYIPTDSIYRGLIDNLIINNERFFKWPAATRVHHAYPGGLLKHSYGVLKNVISTWEDYRGENLNLELLVTGAALHDIGKLTEYNEDGSRTIFGDLIPHPVSGVESITEYYRMCGIDSNTNMKLLALKHIILSHHDKLEFGAATRPGIAEAYVVAMADDADAKLESINHAMVNLTPGGQTNKLISLDDGKCLRWC